MSVTYEDEYNTMVVYDVFHFGTEIAQFWKKLICLTP